MPHEAVYEDELSTKSDVYAFGVVVWEVFSKGDLPFPKLNDNSILNKLKEKSLEWKAHKETPAALEKLQVSNNVQTVKNRFRTIDIHSHKQYFLKKKRVFKT